LHYADYILTEIAKKMRGLSKEMNTAMRKVKIAFGQIREKERLEVDKLNRNLHNTMN